MKKYLEISICSLIFIFALLFLNSYVNKNLSYHADEYEWVGRSYFFDLLIQQKFQDPLWQSYYSYDHPKLVYYLYGAYLYPSYLYSQESSYTDFLKKFHIIQDGTDDTPSWYAIQYAYKSIDETSNCQNKYCQSILLIDQVRILNIIMLSFTTVLIYLITRLILNSIYSTVVTILWIMNPIINIWGVMAVGEGTFLLFF